MKMTMYSEYDPEERARLLQELRVFLEENNPPLFTDLLGRIKQICGGKYSSIPELVQVINHKIYPSKVVYDPILGPVVTREDFYRQMNSLRMIDTRDENSQQRSQALPSPTIKLQQINYDPIKGLLSIPGYEPVPITKNGKVLHTNGKQYHQCWLMKLVFKSVKSMNKGVEYSKILSVNKAVLDDRMRSRIKSYVDEINKKVSDKTPIEKLIKMQKDTVFVNHSYL